MTGFFIKYMVLWGSVCVIALLLIILRRKSIELLNKAYWSGLFQGWKVTSFVFALLGIVVIAPYTGDPTWDYVDATFMSVLAYTTAPWAVGTLYLAIQGKCHVLNAYIALCVWLFSASWSYDLYLVIRDGYYPVTWYSNIFASSVLYLSAGQTTITTP